MLKIFICAGEHSGDLLGAYLIRALKYELETQNYIDFQGVGGPLMEREGFKSLFDFSVLSVMGIKDIFKNFIPIFKILRHCFAPIFPFLIKPTPYPILIFLRRLSANLLFGAL